MTNEPVPLPSPAAGWKDRVSAGWLLARRHHNLLFFFGGFLFDILTLDRIDAWLDLSIQFCYLAAVAAILDRQALEQLGLWKASGRWEKWWSHNTEAVHFLYGSLLSAYVVFYSKSSTFSRSALFLIFVGVLMVANEMPQVQKLGSRLRFGLFALCLASYLIYLLPVAIGHMGAWIFLLSILLSAAICAGLIWSWAKKSGSTRRQAFALAGAPALVLSLLVVFYWLRLIPPVPLSLQFAGVYHRVQRQDADFVLTYRKPPFYAFWRKDDRVFLARPEDSVHCFARIFAPARFSGQIYMRWLTQDASGTWATSQRVPLEIHGGRGQGFRAFSAKSRYVPGRWRVDVETEDERVIGSTSFSLKQDAGQGAIEWKERRM